MNINKTLVKWILGIIGGGIALYLTYLIVSFVVILIAFGMFDSSSYEELVENYQSKEREIVAIKQYVQSITPPGKSVHIEFESDDKLGIFHVVDQGNYNSNWDVDTDSFRADSLLRQLGWNRETVSTLKAKLDKANCISVQSGEPCTIGYQRSGLGMYSYNLFDNPLTDSLKTQYNDSCRYVVFAPKLVLEYGGGAIGPQCFPDFRW
jgi:hypothetical protein